MPQPRQEIVRNANCLKLLLSPFGLCRSGALGAGGILARLKYWELVGAADQSKVAFFAVQRSTRPERWMV
jgi:hypothetical protein